MPAPRDSAVTGALPIDGARASLARLEDIRRGAMLQREKVLSQPGDEGRLGGSLVVIEQFIRWLGPVVDEAERLYQQLREHVLLPSTAIDETYMSTRHTELESLLSEVESRYQGLQEKLRLDFQLQTPEEREVTLDENSIRDTEQSRQRGGGRLRALIVTALALEAAAVREHLGGDLVRSIDPRGTVLEDGVFSAADATEWDVRVVATGDKNERSATLTALAVSDFAPDFVFFVGVAGSVKDIGSEGVEVELGDVVTSSYVYPMTGKLKDDSTQLRPHSLPASHALEQAVLSAQADDAMGSGNSGQWWRSVKSPLWQVDDSVGTPQVFHKPIVASNFVVASRSHLLFQALVATYPDAYAVDMEGYGFLTALHVLDCKGIVIRGLSDNLDGKTSSEDEKWQPAAARNAAAYCFSVLDRLAVR